MFVQGGDDNAGDGIEEASGSRFEINVDLTQREPLLVHMIGYKNSTVETL